MHPDVVQNRQDVLLLCQVLVDGESIAMMTSVCLSVIS